jgi:hypothetical protein
MYFLILSPHRTKNKGTKSHLTMHFRRGLLNYYLKLCLMTHPQLLEGLKCESQIENNERARSQGTLPSSQHYRGVEGHAEAPGWD